jgi:7,8-dihydropterin-6-yl-methyl-4-(beta-D-ribofuranosyl)aminobenzene 5'-phosphate synthase
MRKNSITVVYNNYQSKKILETGWGFSAYIEFDNKKILFDTGGKGSKFLHNINGLNIDLTKLSFIFLSHNHWDHVGGFDDTAEMFSNKKVFIPEDYSIKKHEKKNINFIKKNSFSKIAKNTYTTRQLGRGIKEQSLVLDTEKGLIIITGCAHPGVENIVEEVRKNINKDIYLVTGGFHLKESSKNHILNVINKLKNNGVINISPSHCTGDKAIELIKENWKSENFIKLYLGDKFNF